MAKTIMNEKTLRSIQEVNKDFLKNQALGGVHNRNILNEEHMFWHIVINNPSANMPNYNAGWSGDIATDKANLTDYLQATFESAEYIAASLEKGLEENHTEHLHLFICFPKKRSGNSIFNALGGHSHLESVKGNFQGMRDYIFKEGKWKTDEKHNEKIDGWQIEIGSQPQKKQGKRSDLEQIKELIEQGLTPDEIIDRNVRYIILGKYINELFYKYRLKHMSLQRDVEVIVHTGVSGSGKTYFLTELDKDKTHVGTDYSNGLFDGYTAQEVLFLDEFRGQIPYNTFLTILDSYIHEVHARYSNRKMLWNTVHITSVIPLEDWYNPDNVRDTIEQLKRRITSIIFHFMSYKNVYITDKVKFLETHEKSDIEYHAVRIKGTRYTCYEKLEEVALKAVGVLPWFFPWSKYHYLSDDFVNFVRKFHPDIIDRLEKRADFAKAFEEWEKSDEGKRCLQSYNHVKKHVVPFYDEERRLLEKETKYDDLSEVDILTSSKPVSQIDVVSRTDATENVSDFPFEDNDDNPFADIASNDTGDNTPFSILDFVKTDI